MAHAGSASIVKVHDNRYVRAYAHQEYPYALITMMVGAYVVYMIGMARPGVSLHADHDDGGVRVLAYRGIPLPHHPVTLSPCQLVNSKIEERSTP